MGRRRRDPQTAEREPPRWFGILYMRSGSFAKRGQGCCTLHRKICPHLRVSSCIASSSQSAQRVHPFLRTTKTDYRWPRFLRAPQLLALVVLAMRRCPAQRKWRYFVGILALAKLSQGVKVCGLATSPRKRRHEAVGQRTRE